MRFSSKCVYIALLMGSCSMIYGNERKDQDTLEYIYEYAQDSIERIEDEKVFLRPEHLWVHQGQLYLALAYGDVMSLPPLFSEGDGLYLVSKKQTTLYICRACTKTYYNYKPDQCERCLCRDFLVRFQN